MSDYISTGNLAIDLKTSKQKIGQIINSLEIERYIKRDGKWYNKCIAIADVDRVMAVIDDFQVDQTGTKVLPEQKRKRRKANEFGDNSAKLFKNPIVVVDLKRGVTDGQGICAWWNRESYEIIREG